jgi:hypothetical protein
MASVSASSASAQLAALAADYRHKARRLRHRLRHDPGRMHQSLGELSTRYDRQRSVATADEQPVASGQVIRPHCESFAQHVATMLEGPVLRYSNRLGLLREAERRGIGRFEANLVIAVVQHQQRQMPTARARATEPAVERRPGWSLATCLGVILAVQSVIVAAAWAAFVR